LGDDQRGHDCKRSSEPISRAGDRGCCSRSVGSGPPVVKMSGVDARRDGAHQSGVGRPSPTRQRPARRNRRRTAAGKRTRPRSLAAKARSPKPQRRMKLFGRARKAAGISGQWPDVAASNRKWPGAGETASGRRGAHGASDGPKSHNHRRVAALPQDLGVRSCVPFEPPFWGGQATWDILVKNQQDRSHSACSRGAAFRGNWAASPTNRGKPFAISSRKSSRRPIPVLDG